MSRAQFSDYRAAAERSAFPERTTSGQDNLMHSSIQPWSAGPLFPAVIAVVEQYERYAESPQHRFNSQCREAFYEKPAIHRRIQISVELIYPGFKTERFATWDDAVAVAQARNQSAHRAACEVTAAQFVARFKREVTAANAG